MCERVVEKVWPRTRAWPDWDEIWTYRGLLGLLIKRELKVRYYGTLLGVLWGPIRVLFTVVLMSVVFNTFAKFSTAQIPYPLFVLAALPVWDLVSQAVPRASGNLMAAQSLITKVHFPRIFFPLAATLSVMLETSFIFLLFMGIMLYLDLGFAVQMLLAPLYFAGAGLLAFSLSLWVSAISLKLRDLGHSLPYLLTFVMLMSPVGYAASQVGPRWATAYSLNPLVGLIEGMRSALLSTASPAGFQLLSSFIVTVLLLLGGLLFFERQSKDFAEFF